MSLSASKLGRLVSHTEDGRKVDYTIDYTSALPRNLVETVGSEVTKNLYGLDLLAKIVTGPSVPNPVTTYIQHDRLGSIVQATNASGAVVGSVTYDEWGNVTSGGVATVGELTLDLKNYTGHDYDDVLGLYFAQARLYDAETKRFAARDAANRNQAEIQSSNRYVYCLSNTLIYIDYNGKYEVYIGDTLVKSATVTSNGILVASLSEMEGIYKVPYVSAPGAGRNSGYYQISTSEYEGRADVKVSGNTQLYTSTYRNKWSGITKTSAGSGFYDSKNDLSQVDYFAKMMCDIGKGKIFKLVITAADLKLLNWTNVTGTTVSDLNRVLQKYQINTPSRVCHFLAQCAIESGFGSILIERYDGNSPEEYFGPRDFSPYNNAPDITGAVNYQGKATKGDGAKYRGAGYRQLTWKEVYYRFYRYIGDKKIMEKGASYVAEKYPWESAGWEWTIADNLNSHCDQKEIKVDFQGHTGINSAVKEITKIVNGGYTALAERNSAYYACRDKLFGLR